jgi:hypothetical protein
MFVFEKSKNTGIDFIILLLILDSDLYISNDHIFIN